MVVCCAATAYRYDFTKKDARQTYLSVYLGRRTVLNAVGYHQFMFASTRKIFVKFQPKYNITQSYNAIEYATIFINDYIEYLQQHFCVTVDVTSDVFICGHFWGVLQRLKF